MKYVASKTEFISTVPLISWVTKHLSPQRSYTLHSSLNKVHFIFHPLICPGL